jgi:hypothetical protein
MSEAAIVSVRIGERHVAQTTVPVPSIMIGEVHTQVSRSVAGLIFVSV